MIKQNIEILQIVYISYYANVSKISEKYVPFWYNKLIMHQLVTFIAELNSSFRLCLLASFRS